MVEEDLLTAPLCRKWRRGGSHSEGEIVALRVDLVFGCFHQRKKVDRGTNMSNSMVHGGGKIAERQISMPISDLDLDPI